MSYIAVNVVIEGAWEEELTFADTPAGQESFDAWLKDVEADAMGDGTLTEVYILRHDHPMDVDCECIQYVTDHRPDYTFPTPPEE